jgi:DNA-binding NtrC family response regulator
MIKNTPIFLIVDKENQSGFSSLSSTNNQSIQCLQVYTAAGCLSTVMKKNVGVVLIDENLPDLSGLTLVSLLKKVKPEMEIIFTTSYHDPQKEIDARLAGILYYGVKPLDWTLLQQIIERALSKQNKTLILSHHS